MESQNEYIHVSRLVDFVQLIIEKVVYLTGAEVKDVSLIVANELSKSGVSDNCNFLNECKFIVYLDGKANRIH